MKIRFIPLAKHIERDGGIRWVDRENNIMIKPRFQFMSSFMKFKKSGLKYRTKEELEKLSKGISGHNSYMIFDPIDFDIEIPNPKNFKESEKIMWKIARPYLEKWMARHKEKHKITDEDLSMFD